MTDRQRRDNAMEEEWQKTATAQSAIIPSEFKSLLRTTFMLGFVSGAAYQLQRQVENFALATDASQESS